MNGRRVASLIIATVLAAAGLLEAQTIELQPVMDGTLYEHPSGALANGSGSHLFAGRTAQPFARRALLAFDVASAIPAGATILSVELQLDASRVADSTDRTIRLHRVTESWGEGASDAPGEEGGGDGLRTRRRHLDPPRVPEPDVDAGRRLLRSVHQLGARGWRARQLHMGLRPGARQRRPGLARRAGQQLRLDPDHVRLRRRDRQALQQP